MRNFFHIIVRMSTTFLDPIIYDGRLQSVMHVLYFSFKMQQRGQTCKEQFVSPGSTLCLIMLQVTYPCPTRLVSSLLKSWIQWRFVQSLLPTWTLFSFVINLRSTNKHSILHKTQLLDIIVLWCPMVDLVSF